MQPLSHSPGPRPTAAQVRSRTNCELMMIDALQGLDSETIGPMVGRLLADRFGADTAERIGDRIAREAHLCGRGN